MARLLSRVDTGTASVRATPPGAAAWQAEEDDEVDLLLRSAKKRRPKH